MNKPFDSYLGGKGCAGTYQQIINLIPPCNTLVIPFLGNCAITRNIRLPEHVLLNDIDGEVVKAWSNVNGDIPGVEFCNMDAVRFMMEFERNWIGDVVVYCDPCYLFNTRTSEDTRYKYDSGQESYHLKLLTYVKCLRNPVLISCYDNDLYKSMLPHWNKTSFKSSTRGGVRIETVYYNFNNPNCYLQDYQHTGSNYRERERIKNKVRRKLSSIMKMPAKERNYLFSLLGTDQSFSEFCSTTNFVGSGSTIKNDVGLPGDLPQGPNSNSNGNSCTTSKVTVIDQ